jgi:hypothetical protein
VQLVPYAGVMNVPDAAHDGQGEPVARSGLIDHLTPEFAAAAVRLLESGTAYFFQVRSVGGAVAGAVADVADDATAYSHPSANFSVVAFGASRSRLDAEWADLAAHFRGLYLSFETGDHPRAHQRCVAGGDPRPATDAQETVRPGERLPGQLQHRPAWRGPDQAAEPRIGRPLWVRTAARALRSSAGSSSERRET